MSSARYLHFGPFRMDRVEGRLWRQTAPIRMSRKAQALLTCLAEHAGQLVTKEALLTAVWPRAVVVEAVLTTAVREVRRALDDRRDQPAFVQTVHGRGYRFIAPVVEHDDLAPSPHVTARLPDGNGNASSCVNDSQLPSPASVSSYSSPANRASARPPWSTGP